MPKRRSFTAELKSQLVLKVISGEQSAADLCREHQVKPQLLSEWKTAFVQNDGRLQEAEIRIAELEWQIGRQTMELESWYPVWLADVISPDAMN